MHHPEVLETFRSFPDNISLKEMRLRLGDKRYKLDDYRRADGTWRCGFVPLETGPIAYQWNGNRSDDSIALEKFAAKRATAMESGKKSRTWDYIFDIVFLLFLIGVQGVLIAYFKEANPTPFNNFFNSNTFGPRFTMAALATVVSLNWKRLEREVHTLSPWHRLSKSPAPPRRSILLEGKSIPYTALFATAFNGHFFAAATALVAILADILVITLGGVPYSPGQILTEFFVCSYVSMAILGAMILCVIILIIWRMRGPKMPREPNTVLSVMSYVANARMLDDFEGLEVLGSKKMDERIRGLGKRYGYGSFVGVDGRQRQMVDEEFRLVV